MDEHSPLWIRSVVKMGYNHTTSQTIRLPTRCSMVLFRSFPLQLLFSFAEES